MRMTMLRGAAATVLAVAVALPGTARPAQADWIDDATKVINFANSAFSLIKNLVGGGMSIEAATQQILASITEARGAILTQLDRLAAAEARACATAAVIEFADIEHFTTDVLQGFAQEATRCVTTVDSLLGVVTDKGATDVLGFALNTVGPVAQVARARAGFGTAALNPVLAHGNTTLIPKIITDSDCWPEVEVDDNPRHVYPTYLRCRAYNGEVGEEFRIMAIVPKYNYATAMDRATVHTSRAIAKAVLPLLQ